METMVNMEDLARFYRGKKVLITGHTGFKGSWLSQILIMFGADTIGYSLQAPTTPNLFELLGLENKMTSIIGDVRDKEHLMDVFKKYQPEIVFHLAAQPIVRDSYKDPHYTYETNVMGTVNLLECIRLVPSIKSFLNVTTDKVYENNDKVNHPFKEDEKLDGSDPYSNSKSCSEIITHSYYKSFLKDMNIAVSTARAGNVIGGGDFSNDRIIPDCVRSLINKTSTYIRHPHSIRPYQHVLEPLYCYLTIAAAQYEHHSLSSSYNIGPDKRDCVNTLTLVNYFASHFLDFHYSIINDRGPHEAAFLMLDNTKIKSAFGWKPKLNIADAIRLTCDWTKAYLDNEDVSNIVKQQINYFFNL